MVFGLMMLGAVPSKRVVGEVPTRIAPHGVHVVRITGRVVVLDENGRTV